MTREEVLQGALSLNGDDKNYIVTVNGDKITVEKKKASIDNDFFSCTAHLNDDNTYVETQIARSGAKGYGGKSASASVSFSFSFNKDNGNIEVEKRTFSSADCKRVLRDYLSSCGYKRTNKGFFKRLFQKK